MVELRKHSLPEGIQAVIRLIAEAVRPEKIYLLGPSGVGETQATDYLELLVVIPISNPSSFADLEPVVEFACLGHRNVSCTLCKADQVQRMLLQGHIFYSFACLLENLVYSDGSCDFTPTPEELLAKVKEESIREFHANFSKASAFYNTAVQYHANGHKVLAPFMLHQATELTLRALLISAMGKEKRTHSIKVLLRNVRRIAPAVCKVFPRDTEKERILVHLLEEAYLHSRYESGFCLEEEVVVELIKRVKKLQLEVQNILDVVVL